MDYEPSCMSIYTIGRFYAFFFFFPFLPFGLFFFIIASISLTKSRLIRSGNTSVNILDSFKQSLSLAAPIINC